VVLEDHRVRLEPLEAAHERELAEATADGSLWVFSPQDADGGEPSERHRRFFRLWFDRARTAHAQGSRVVFVVRRQADRRVVGTTSYLNLDPANRRAEIGATFYEPAARGTFVNPACKRLLLTHLFEEVRVVRVELRCDARNAASRAAIAKLGARQEGVLRRHMILFDGYVRDTVLFAVVDEEWPRVKAGLTARLG
jgi:RimJ/RimL family protein N-acetyltransferase